MCISTAYENNENGAVLAENIVKVVQQDGSVIMTDIMSEDTIVRGDLKLADLTRGILIIQKVQV